MLASLAMVAIRLQLSSGVRHTRARPRNGAPVHSHTLVRPIATLLVPLLVACATSTHVISPWVIVTKGSRATVSLDTSRIEARARGYRVHVQTQFTEPAYRPEVGGPAYDLGEASLDVDCDGRQALSLEAIVFDSLRQPVHRETYPQAQWQDFRQHDLGEDILADLCRVLARVRPRRGA